MHLASVCSGQWSVCNLCSLYDRQILQMKNTTIQREFLVAAAPQQPAVSTPNRCFRRLQLLLGRNPPAHECHRKGIEQMLHEQT